MSFSPSPSPRKRAHTVDSPTRAWNVSTGHIATDRPLSALRSPNKASTSTSPSHMALPPSPMPKFDLSTAIPKSPSPIRTIRGSPKKEVHEYEVPIFDFSMRGNTVQKPPALRRKPLMATAGQAVSHAIPMGKTTVAMEVPDKPFVVKATIVAESAVGLRVKQAHEVPLPESPMPGPSSRMVDRLKQQTPENVPLPESPMPAMPARQASRLKKLAAETVTLPESPLPAISARQASRLKQQAPESIPLPESPIAVISPDQASRLKQAPESVPLPEPPMPGPSSRVVDRLKQQTPENVPLPESPMPAMPARQASRLKGLAAETVTLPESPLPAMSAGQASRLKQTPESVPLPPSPMVAATVRVPTTPRMRASYMRSTSEASQRSVASLQKLSPGTKKHVAPQLLDKADKPPSKATPTGAQSRRKERQAAKFTPDQSGEQQAARSAIDGRGLGLSPTKAAKAPSVHIGPAKTRMAVGGAFSQPQSPSAGSPKMERQTVDGEIFLVSSKPFKLQTKLQISPRTGVPRAETPKSTTPKTVVQAMGHFSKPIEFGVVRGGELQFSSSKRRNVSDSTSAAADDERGTISRHKLELGRKISESEAHVLAVDPKIGHRKPSSRKLNCVSDSVVSKSPEHHESIESHAQQYIAHTVKKNSLLDVVDDFQKELKKSPLGKSSPIMENKLSKASEEAEYQAILKKAFVSSEEVAYQAMIKKAYVDERPKLPINMARPRSRHRHGSSGQTQIGASESRNGSSSEFSVDFLKADASQEIILETFTKMNKFGGSTMERTDLSPVREPVSPSKKTRLADGGNFACRMSETRINPVRAPMSPSKKMRLAEGGNFTKPKDVSPSERAHTLELDPVMPSHDLGFHLSSDHPRSPLKNKGKGAIVPSTPSIVDADPFSHFDEVGLDDDDALERENVYHATRTDELEKRASVADVMKAYPSKKQHRYGVDNHVVDKAAVAVIEESHNLQAHVDNQLMREMAKYIHTAHCATATTNASLNKNTALHHKSSLSSHQSSSIASVKSVRWHPSIDSVRSVDSPVVEEKAAEKDAKKTSVVPTPEKKSAAEIELQNLFVPDVADLAVDEAHAIALFARTLKAKKCNQSPKFLELLRELHEEIEQNNLHEPDKILEGEDNFAEVHRRGVVNATPAPRWNPTVPAFTPRDMKENDAWVVDQDLARQRRDMAMSIEDIDAWSKPTEQGDVGFNDPAILSASPTRKKAGSQNLFHDPAILSVSPGRMRAMRGGNLEYEFREPFMSENFVDALFSSVGDPAILSIGHSPSRRHHETSHQTDATAAVSVPGTTVTQSVRKRIIWDNPNEPGGREAIILSKKYSEECLEQFRQKYPMTGQKAKVLPKKKLEDLPKKYEEEVLLGVVGGLKPKKLATEAADIQQKLELLLLKKKETKVKKIRETSGNGAAWGLSSVRGTVKSEAV